MTLATLLLIVVMFVFIVGLCIGSFLNVVILRAFSNESISFPGSKCPKCQKPLKWYHNIPLLSYAILKGKCAFCHEKISIQYPIVELLTGLIFVLIFFKFGLGFNAILMATFASIFIVLAATDIKEKVVFDAHTYTLAALGLIYNLFNIGVLHPGYTKFTLFAHNFSINNSFVSAVIGLVAGIVIMEFLARLGYLFVGARAFGEGDTFIAAGLGAVFGADNLIKILVISIVIQLIFAIPIFLKKLYIKKDYKTLIGFLSFFLFIIFFKWINTTPIVNNTLLYLIFVLMLCVLGIYVCKRILKGVKGHQEDMTYLPFGPSMVIAALIAMLFII